MIEDQKIKEILIEKNLEFKELFLRHQRFEEDLQKMQQKKAHSEEEQVQEQNIKKQKLKTKDAMQKIIFDFKKNLG